MLESFFQSIRCPLQILLVGDPLAQPWAHEAKLILHGIKNKIVSGIIKVQPEVVGVTGHHYGKFMFLLDGIVIGREKTLEFDTSSVEKGIHTLRVVGYSTGLVKSQVFTVKKFMVEN